MSEIMGRNSFFPEKFSGVVTISDPVFFFPIYIVLEKRRAQIVFTMGYIKS